MSSTAELEAQARELLVAWRAEADRVGAITTAAWDKVEQARQLREKAWKRAKRAKHEGEAQEEYQRIAADVTAAEGAFDKARVGSYDALHMVSHLERMLPERSDEAINGANSREELRRLGAPCRETGAGHRLATCTKHLSGPNGGYSAAGVYCEDCRAEVYVGGFDGVLAVLDAARLQGLVTDVPLLPPAPVAQ
jgi:hypothetical protein